MFLADLARRILLLSGLVIFLVPLTSIVSSGAAFNIATLTIAAIVGIVTAVRPAAGLVAFSLILALAVARADVAGAGLAVVQLTEAVVLAFIAGALARSILDGRLFMDSRLARPAFALATLVAVSGLCTAFEQSADARAAMAGLWRSAKSYFADPAALYTLQPTLHWLEFSALVPLVELSIRRRPAWRNVTLIVWLGASLVAGSQMLAFGEAQSTASDGSVHFNSRVEMVKVALETASQAPLFGIGLGGFVWALPANLEPTFFLPLVVLVELGCIGLVTFGWLLWSAVRPVAPVDHVASSRTARTVVIAAVGAWLVGAMFVHPQFAYPIAVATFVTLGFAAGMLPAREPSNAPGPRGWAEWIVLAVVLVSLPWRINHALSPGTPEVVGAGPVERELEGVGFRIAEPRSRWRLPVRSRTVVALMRWDPAGATDCSVRIAVRDRPPDEVSLRNDMWIPVRVSIPPGRPSESPEIEFQVSSARCRLFVGTVTATR